MCADRWGRGDVEARAGLPDPVPEPLGRALRRAVLDHVTSERRRVFAPTAHVGTPGSVVTSLCLGRERFDHALRTEVLEAMLRRAGVRDGQPRLCWLTRRGTLEVQDVDLAWSGAARTAALELGMCLPMVVVTREGWRDPASGATRTWRRLRPSRP